jgi:opacity protein-like surface antigen
MKTIRTPILIALLATLAALPAAAQRRPYGNDGGTLRLRFGEFTPAGDNDYWIDKRADFTGDEDDFADDLVAVDYLHPLGPRMGLLISASSWEADAAQEYDDYEDPDGRGIFHTTSFELTSLEAGLVWNLTDRNAAISPYIGIGGGYYDWSLSEDGEFIDFADLSIFDARFTDSGDSFGWFWVAGVEVPVAASWRLFAEGRWSEVEDDLSGDFEGLGTLELSGTTIAFGVGWSL